MSKDKCKTWWSDCGQIMFSHGSAFGLRDDLTTAYLGEEDAVLAYVSGELVESGINRAEQAAIDWVREYREQEGYNNDRLSKRSMERVGDGGTSGCDKEAARILTPGERLAKRDAHARDKGLSRR